MASALCVVILLSGITARGQMISTVAGGGTTLGDGGLATAALIEHAFNVGIDGAGNFYIAEANTSLVRKVNSVGIISTIAGQQYDYVYNGEGGLATASSLAPESVVCDAVGNIYIADPSNFRILRINAAGIINTIAGTGTSGYSGDGGLATAAELGGPKGIALDAAGNLYIADGAYVRKITITGIISTVAGNGIAGYSGNGSLATAAQINARQIACDAVGNIYISETTNNRVRKINTSGIISLVAGNGTPGYSGDGSLATAAQLSPIIYGLAVDTTGNVYIADQGNHVIRMVNTSGIISTVAGTAGSAGYSGDGGPAIAAQFHYPTGIAIDASNNLYIADQNNGVIRKVMLPPPCDTVTAGTIVHAGNDVFCGSGGDTLILTGASLGGSINYQWQSAPDAFIWTNVGANDTVYPTGILTATTYFRVIAICTASGIFDTTAVDTFTINPFVTPSVSISAAPGTVVSSGQAVTFTALVTNGGGTPTFQWRKNGLIISGATANPYLTTATANGDIISCVVHSNAPCTTIDSAVSNTLVMVVAPLGIGTVTSGNSNINLYPNPNKGAFHIKGFIADSNKVQIEVLNIVGQAVYRQKFPVQNNYLDEQIVLPQDLSNGIYLLRVGNGAKQFMVGK
jgi:sugar lactone lactonase YvrE